MYPKSSANRNTIFGRLYVSVLQQEKKNKLKPTELKNNQGASVSGFLPMVFGLIGFIFVGMMTILGIEAYDKYKAKNNEKIE